MQKVLIAIVFPVFISTAVSKSTITKDFLVNKKITFNQNHNDVKTVQDRNKHNNAAKLITNKEKDVFNYNKTFNNAPPEYKASEIISQHFKNVQNANKPLNVKIIQTNQTLSGNYTKLGEKLASYKLNTTANRPENVPEMTAPTMIPIFRPIQANVKSSPQPLPNELIRVDEALKQTNKSDTIHSSDQGIGNGIIFLNSLHFDNNSTNGIEMLNLDQTLNLLKQQQNAAHFQMVNIVDTSRTESNAVAETSTNRNNVNIIGVNNNEEELSAKGLEITDMLNPNINFVNTIPSGNSERVNQPKITQSINGNPISLHIDTRQPLLKFEYIPPSGQNNPSSVQNFNVNKVPIELNTNSKAVPQQQNFASLPNNLIIESMKFIPYYEMHHELESKNHVSPHKITQNEMTPISEMKYSVPASGFSEIQNIKENVEVPRENQPQTNHLANAKFNIPCHKAADVLNDLFDYNPSITQQNMKTKSNHMAKDLTTKLPCDIESGKANLEDESLAIIFKPKNISLLKLYGDVLKKITLTVLVPYHISKLTN